MKYRAVIFDLDGVICHTDQYHYQAWKAVADELGIYFDEVINNRLRGVSRMESFNIILERYDGEMDRKEKEFYTEKKNNIYKELLKNMSPADLSAEVKDTLDVLREAGCLLAIGSSSKNAKFILGQLGLGDYFDAISDGNNITHSKPDPEVFVKAAQFLGEKPENCLVVEDAKAGLEAAIAGGMHCAAIGDATACNLATINLQTFGDLKKLV
ncbi:MAG: beta-phosphoglucomutase [Lachnospiraceae bacterium]